MEISFEDLLYRNERSFAWLDFGMMVGSGGHATAALNRGS